MVVDEGNLSAQLLLKWRSERAQRYLVVYEYSMVGVRGFEPPAPASRMQSLY